MSKKKKGSKKSYQRDSVGGDKNKQRNSEPLKVSTFTTTTDNSNNPPKKEIANKKNQEESLIEWDSKNLDYKFNKEYYEQDIFRLDGRKLVTRYEEIENIGDEKLKERLDNAHDKIIALSKNYPSEYKSLWLYQLKPEVNEQKPKSKIEFWVMKTDDENKNATLSDSNYQNREGQSFKLKIAYPGLAIGLGNPHGTAFKGDIQLGMSFDYVTGLPFVSGSSLKGKLRSIMEKLIDDQNVEDLTEEDPDKITKITLSDYLQMQDSSEGKLSKKQICELVDAIFEGVSWAEKDGKIQYSEGEPVKEEIPMGDRDVFYGGIVVPENGKAFLKQDFLAPHPSKIQSPNVLKFLAIAPDTEIEFFFSLKDSKLKSGEGNTIITAEQKAEMFFNLLKDFGVGAKTNVGYGIME